MATAKELFEKDIVEGTSGNVSARMTDGKHLHHAILDRGTASSGEEEPLGVVATQSQDLRSLHGLQLL
jgi:ribulose-5-phosphate 4-epimerase/fuculose-1-phosphate aldolase